MSYLYELITCKEDEFLHTVHVTYEKSKIILKLRAFRDPESRIQIQYQKVGQDTQISCYDEMDTSRKKEILVEGNDFLSVFSDDLEKILLNRNTELDQFKIDNRNNGEKYEKEEEEEYRINYLDPICRRVNQKLSRILKYRDQKLQVKKLDLKISEENQITSILPYIDPNTITYFWLKFKTSDPKVSLADMWSLDFWRFAKPLHVGVHVDKFYPEMMISLKEAFYTNSNLNVVDITFSEFASDKIKEQLLIPNTDEEILEISCGKDRVFSTRIKPRNGGSTRNWLIKKDPEKLSIKPRRQRQTKETKAKNAINVQKVFENDVILKTMLEYFNFYEIQTLRRVSRNLRQSMDRLKPDPFITKCCFDIYGLNKVQVKTGTYENCFHGWPLQYVKRGNGCNVKKCENFKIKYVPEEYRIRCLKDFEINMEHRRSRFDELTFRLSHSHDDDDGLNVIESLKSSIFPFLESFEEFFGTRTPLKTRKLEMELSKKTTTDLQQNEVMKVLPFLDPKIFEIINLDIRYRTEEDILMEVDKISKSEQWRNAKELKILGCIILTPIQEMNLTHFTKGDLTVQTISLEDLRLLKEGFQNSSNLEKFKIAFKECTFHEFRNEEIYQFIGIPHIQANPLLRYQRNIWYCRMRNTHNILHILHSVGHCITFAAVEPSDAPESAWIHD